MQTRTYNQSLSQRASARRRIRRATGRLYCTTNGCTTYLEPDPSRDVARCPVCGARRRLH